MAINLVFKYARVYHAHAWVAWRSEDSAVALSLSGKDMIVQLALQFDLQYSVDAAILKMSHSVETNLCTDETFTFPVRVLACSLAVKPP